jgi:hypothetical protein
MSECNHDRNAASKDFVFLAILGFYLAQAFLQPIANNLVSRMLGPNRTETRLRALEEKLK